MFIRNLSVSLGLLGAITVTNAVAVEAYPARPVSLVVGFAPGGASDVVARQVAAKLSPILGQSVIVDNRPGAGGTIAAGAVAQAAPDGYTLLFASASALAISPWLNKQLKYNGVTSFSPVIELVRGYYILSGTPALEVANVEDLIDYAARNPGRLNCGSAGPGTIHHLSCELLGMSIDVPMTHVPYKGSSPAFVGLMSGEIQVMFESVPTPISLIESGRIRGLAVTSPKRLDALPNVPTFIEQGVEGIDVSFWFGVVAPAGTPVPVVTKLNTVLNQVLKDPEVLETFEKQGLEVVGGSPEAFGSLIKGAVSQWGAVVDKANVKID